MTLGIHHITAISSDAQTNFDFYSKVLGLRLVKKTVNQDDPKTYHLFYGDKLGNPGMDLTFFVFLPSYTGENGSGLVNKVSLAVPVESLEYWKDRFETLKIKHNQIVKRFDVNRLEFFDNDNLSLELVADSNIKTTDNVWTEVISRENAITSFYSASLGVASKLSVEPILLNVFGYKEINNDKNITLYKLEDSDRANFIEIIEEPSAINGINGAGTVHHIAFRASNEDELNILREKVLRLGLYPTGVIDRFYFKSVYFRTPAGILFEIATDKPGFTADQNESELGKKLALPPFLEARRLEIEKYLPSLITEQTP